MVHSRCSAGSRTCWTTLLLGAAMLAAVVAPAGAQSSGVRQQLAAQYARLSQSYRARDVAGILSLFTRDAVARLPDGQVIYRNQMAGSLRAQLASVQRVRTMSYHIDSLTVSGKTATAVATGTSSVVIADATGTPHTVDQTNRVRHIWIRTKQGWRIRRMEMLGLRIAADGKPTGPLRVPPEAALERLIAASLTAWNQAVQSGDFRAFHASLARPFRERYTPDALRDAFSQFAAKGVDISGIARQRPVLTSRPILSPEGVLQVEGTYATTPRQVRFTLNYAWDEGAWRLLNLNVTTR